MHRSGLHPTSHNYAALMTLPLSHTVSSVTLMRKATDALENMRSKGVVPSVHFYSAYIAVCGRARSLSAAQTAWEDMLSRGIMPNIVAFTSLVDTYGKCGNATAALDTYQQMQSMRIKPDDRLYAAMLRALQTVSNPAMARKVWEDARTADAKLDAIAWTIFMSILLRSGDIEGATSLLKEAKPASVLENRLFNQVFAHAAKTASVKFMKQFEGVREAKGVPHTVLSVNWLLMLRAKMIAGVSRWRLAMGHDDGQVMLQLSTAPELLPELLANIDATPEQVRDALIKFKSHMMDGDPAAVLVAWLSVEGYPVEALELYARIANGLHADVRSWLLYALFAGARLEPPETRLHVVLDVMKEARAWSKVSGWWWSTVTHTAIAAILRPAQENVSLDKGSLE
jgi:pentatricopeptide repeat protein